LAGPPNALKLGGGLFTPLVSSDVGVPVVPLFGVLPPKNTIPGGNFKACGAADDIEVVGDFVGAAWPRSLFPEPEKA